MGEHVDTINQRLRDFYGISLYSDLPKFRIARSEEQYETRWGTFTKTSPSGLILGESTGYQYVRKYGYMEDQWILERLMDVPPGTNLTVKQSYECIWGFRHLDPRECWDAVKVLIDTVLDKVFEGRSRYEKYPMPFEMQNSKEAIRERVDKLKKVLYDDETPLADAIHFGEGIAVPHKEFVNDTNPLINNKDKEI